LAFSHGPILVSKGRGRGPEKREKQDAMKESAAMTIGGQWGKTQVIRGGRKEKPCLRFGGGGQRRGTLRGPCTFPGLKGLGCTGGETQATWGRHGSPNVCGGAERGTRMGGVWNDIGQIIERGYPRGDMGKHYA